MYSHIQSNKFLSLVTKQHCLWVLWVSLSNIVRHHGYIRPFIKSSAFTIHFNDYMESSFGSIEPAVVMANFSDCREISPSSSLQLSFPVVTSKCEEISSTCSLLFPPAVRKKCELFGAIDPLIDSNH